MKEENIKQAIKDIIEHCGEDMLTDQFKGTPDRVVRMYDELLSGYDEQKWKLTTFKNPGYDEMLVETNIPFTSLCAHHFLPFVGVAHIGYMPGEKIVGLSKLARVVHQFGRRLQSQEKMGIEIANYIEEHLKPNGVIVILNSEHMCMTIRGVQAAGTRTITSVARGAFRTNASLKAEFLTLIK